MHRISRLVLVVLLSTVRLFATDVKIRTVSHMAGQDRSANAPWQEEVRYVHGTAQRQEFARYSDASQVPQTQPVARIAFISHCDTGIAYELDLENHEYREFKIQYPNQRDVEKQVADTRKEAEKKKTSTTVDTGETRDFHGHTAKHLITNIETKARPNPSEVTVDGWYLDIAQPGCAPEWARRYLTQEGGSVTLFSVGGGMSSVSQPPSLVAMGISLISAFAGRVPDGLAIEEKIVRRSTAKPNGGTDANEPAGERQVLEFSESPLDPALFEIPPGFTKVKQLHRNKTAQH